MARVTDNNAMNRSRENLAVTISADWLRQLYPLRSTCGSHVAAQLSRTLSGLRIGPRFTLANRMQIGSFHSASEFSVITMFNAKKLTVVRKGQYPTFRQTGSYYLGLPFVISRGFLFSSFVPNLGLPLLFWQKETDLKNGYSLWVPRNVELSENAHLANNICQNAKILLDSIGPTDIRIKMTNQLCLTAAGLKRRWVFDASCTANYNLFESIKKQFELFLVSITQEPESNTLPDV